MCRASGEGEGGRAGAVFRGIVGLGVLLWWATKLLAAILYIDCTSCMEMAAVAGCFVPFALIPSKSAA